MKLKMALLLHSSIPSSLSRTKKTHILFHGTSKSSHIRIRNQDLSSEETTKQPSTGLGFGGSTVSKKKQKGNKEKDSVIRRSPLQKPVFSSESEAVEAQGQTQYETAFLLSWLGLGAIILLEGLTLAASGFLPEEWDGVFVNYLYPSFTPTVFLFVAGTVVYGVTKYLQNEKFNSKN